MKERPILFNAAMVRALLAGTKTQTRRPVNPKWQHFASVCQLPDTVETEGRRPISFPGRTEASFLFHNGIPVRDGEWQPVNCPFGQPGDKLWVRETWRGVVKISPPDTLPEYGVARYVPDQEHCTKVEYAATQERAGEPWRPSIHMPRWASRITLEIVSVRVERLQDISEADAKAEGADCLIVDSYTPQERALFDLPLMENGNSYRNGYAQLWEFINGPGSWDANPWVWAITFKLVKPGSRPGPALEK